MGKAKQPYIPIYIGDWEQDTNTISIEAEGALLKLTFKFWKSEPKGLLQFCLEDLARLFKTTPEKAVHMVEELSRNQVLNITFLEQNLIKFESRRMLKESMLSKVRSDSGYLGGKQNKSKIKANDRQNTEYDIDNDIIKILNNKSEEFQKKWYEWLEYRSEIKKPYKSKKSVLAQLEKFSQLSDKISIAMIQKSIENSWQGIFEIKGEFNKTPQSKIEAAQNRYEQGKEILNQYFENEKRDNNQS